MNSLIGHVLLFLDRVESDLHWLVHGWVMAIDGVIQPEKLLADLVDHRETVNHYVNTSQHCR